MKDALPKGWAIVTLNDLVGPSGLFTDGDWILSAHLKTGKDVRLVQLADVGIGRFLNKSERFISHDTAKLLGVTYPHEADVLISRMAEPLARACLLPKLEAPAITAVDVAIARSDGSVSFPAYLMHVCNSHQVRLQAEQVALGTTRKRISRKNLEQIRVPLPPLNEQRRIVAKLEKLLDKVDSCQKRLSKFPILLKRFRQAVLAAACSGDLTADWREKNLSLASEHRAEFSGDNNQNSKPNLVACTLATPSEWLVSKLRLLVTSLDQGWSPKCHITPSASPDIWGVIKTTAVQSLTFLQAENKSLPEQLTPRPELELRKGDLLITRAGPRARTGICCLVASVRPRLMICDKVYRFRLNESKALSHFVALALNTPSMIEHLDTLKTGISDSGVNLTQEKFLNIAVPVPSLPEQQEIVRRVDELFSLVNQIEAGYANAKQYVDSLKQSILAKEFSGELVAQDPNDEPASALLERIRQAGTNEEPDRSKRRLKKSEPPSPNTSFLVKGECAVCSKPLGGMMSIVQFSDYYHCNSHWGVHVCPKCYKTGNTSCSKCGGPLTFHSGKAEPGTLH